MLGYAFDAWYYAQSYADNVATLLRKEFGIKEVQVVRGRKGTYGVLYWPTSETIRHFPNHLNGTHLRLWNSPEYD